MEATKICQRHGNVLEPERVSGNGCWECDSERYEQQRDLDETFRVAAFKQRRDERLAERYYEIENGGI